MQYSNHLKSILIVGDLFPTCQNVSYFSKGDIETLFGKEIVQKFSEAYFSICNLEGALTDHPDKCKKTGPVKLAPTDAVEAYRKLGINYCLLANNHATDGGHRGMLDTMQTLDNAGIKYIGAGKSENDIVHFFVKEVGGLRVGFYNVSERMYNKPTETQAGAWLYDEYIVCRELAQLKEECDYLIVLYHGGIEKFPYPSPENKKRFHRMADSGADMIIAQHTHCVGCEEYYNSSYLLYGQGDFLLNNFAAGLTDSGLIIELDIEDGQVHIQKHLVKSVDNMYVRYAEQQDLSDFYARSEKVNDDAFVFRLFQKFCDNELKLYLTAFKSPSKLRLRQRKFFPRAYKKWLFRYNERDLLFALHSLRSEQNRETAVVGIEHQLGIS
ncbi:MAG: CapA family protein [Bacteroidales bacterium]|nr:CapA family protein [Bacteroidales bacterium]